MKAARSLVAVASNWPLGGKQGGELHAGLLAQATERQAALGFGLLAEIEGHGTPLFGKIVEQRVERAAPEVEPGFKRFFDAHVEPGFDALGDELHRHRVDQHAGQAPPSARTSASAAA